MDSFKSESNIMERPIGVFGGIFDPVHNGHLATAFLAYDHFHLEKLVFVPAGIPPHKQTSVTASPADRLAMLNIALNDCSFSVIWDNEIRNAGVSYTIDTIVELEARYNENSLYFIIGADNLLEIPTWHRFEAILEKVTLCVAARPGFRMEVPQSLVKARLLFFPSPEWGLSSSMLRSYIGLGCSCNYLLPPGVKEYIMEKGLYKDILTKNSDAAQFCHDGGR